MRSVTINQLTADIDYVDSDGEAATYEHVEGYIISNGPSTYSIADELDPRLAKGDLGTDQFKRAVGYSGDVSAFAQILEARTGRSPEVVVNQTVQQIRAAATSSEAITLLNAVLAAADSVLEQAHDMTKAHPALAEEAKVVELARQLRAMVLTGLDSPIVARALVEKVWADIVFAHPYEAKKYVWAVVDGFTPRFSEKSNPLAVWSEVRHLALTVTRKGTEARNAGTIRRQTTTASLFEEVTEKPASRPNGRPARLDKATPRHNQKANKAKTDSKPKAKTTSKPNAKSTSKATASKPEATQPKAKNSGRRRWHNKPKAKTTASKPEASTTPTKAQQGPSSDATPAKPRRRRSRRPTASKAAS